MTTSDATLVTNRMWDMWLQAQSSASPPLALMYTHRPRVQHVSGRRVSSVSPSSTNLALIPILGGAPTVFFCWREMCGVRFVYKPQKDV